MDDSVPECKLALEVGLGNLKLSRKENINPGISL